MDKDEYKFGWHDPRKMSRTELFNYYYFGIDPATKDGDKTVVVRECPACRGSGVKYNEDKDRHEKCFLCDGEGIVYE